MLRGNVAIVHPAGDREALARLVADVTGLGPGEQDALLRAGQGVALRQGSGRLTAYGNGRLLRPSGPGDPRLRAFVEDWLGRSGG